MTTQAQTTTIKKFDENTVDGVLSRISSFTNAGDLKLPENYSVENAVRSAWLVLQETKDRNEKPALEVCTRESIATALLEMVIKGLSVVKKQGYFIVYGNKLVFEESYIGTIAIAKTQANVKEVNANVIYKGDEFEFQIDTETGRKKITKHIQKLENIHSDNLVGAYAIVNFNDNTSDVEVMNMAQIRQSWMQGASKGNSPAHRNFPDQMAMKTVINRSLKVKIGSSDDSELMKDNPVQASVSQEIAQKANKKELPKAEPKETIQLDVPEIQPNPAVPIEKTVSNEPEIDF